ncbi:MAG: helix-turn-helix transcriptional regulator [Clostridia bacterium]|nr:helix-turn-helix transcriptional regulator [Clostridia bacterium]
MKKYFKHKLENLIVINKIVTIHYFEFEKNFSFSGEVHDFWELVYADKESILCTAGDEEYTLEEGTVAFHKPGEFHAHSANGRRAPNVFVISFECKSEAMRFFEGCRVRPDKSLVRFIYSIVEEAKRTFDIPFSTPEDTGLHLLEHPTLGGQQLIKNYLELFLISLMRQMTENGRSNSIFLPTEKLQSKAVDDCIAVMREKIESTLSVDELSAAVGYSRAYIFREFKRATGKTVMAYFTKLKVEAAKQYLREGDYTVKQIAERLAFDTPNYFSKTFKRYTGMTPVAYKKRAFTNKRAL